MTPDLVVALVKEGVSLAILVFVLYGVYNLTHRMVDVLSEHIERCCESLERIANALDKLSKNKIES